MGEVRVDRCLLEGVVIVTASSSIINSPEGLDSVEAVAGGREWWQLRATDMQACARERPPLSFNDSIERVGHKGDIAYDIKVGGITIRIAGLRAEELRREISQLGSIWAPHTLAGQPLTTVVEHVALHPANVITKEAKRSSGTSSSHTSRA